MNPYRVPDASVTFNCQLVGTIVGAISLIVSAAPALHLTFMLVEMYWSISSMDAPPQNLRPVGLMIVGFKWPAIALVLLTPLSLLAMKIAAKLESTVGREFALVAAGLFTLPFGIGYLGPMLVIALTGAGYGT